MSLTGTTVIRAEEFVPPGPGDFDLPPVGPNSTFEMFGQTFFLGVTKPMLQIVLAAVLVFVFFYVASRQRSMVPSRLQYVAETGYGFVRNSMGRDIIGSRDFMKFVPYLFALFFFVLVNNLFATIPFIQFPTFSRSGMVYGLALLSWIIYNVAGMRQHGVVGYFKLQSVPAGVTGPILLLIVPLEFMSNILVRPVTLALRLFANMFAGHLLVLVFVLGGEYLLLHSDPIINKVAGVASLLFSLLIFGLEIFVQSLQAYIFTMLTAQYISSAAAEEH